MPVFNDYHRITSEFDVTQSEIDQEITKFKAKGGKIKIIDKKAFARGVIHTNNKIPVSSGISGLIPFTIPFELTNN